MNIKKSSCASKETKINISALCNSIHVQASKAILEIHKYVLNKIGELKKPCRLISPFHLFNPQPPVNPLNIAPAQPSVLDDKISTIAQPKSPENPLQAFVKSLKTKAPKPAAPPEFSAEIVDIINENNEFKTLRLKRPSDWKFFPGQYLEIRSEHSDPNKPAILAIASAVSDEYIEITAKPNANPKHSNYCLNGALGEHLEITGPMGTNFPINLITPETPVYVLGGGSGLTALKSLMQSLPAGTDSKLIYSSKTAQELLYKDEIEKWKAEGHIISLTQENAEGFQQGRITEHLSHTEIKPNSLIFLCGPEELVVETAQLLAEMGVPRESIYGSLPETAKNGGPVFRGDHPRMIIA